LASFPQLRPWPPTLYGTIPLLTLVENLKTLIREVPDFPKLGILFYDITTLLKDACGCH